MDKISKIDDVLPSELREGETRKLKDYLGVELVLHSTRVIEGAKGHYMRFCVSLPDTGEQFYLNTGASQPFDVLTYLKDEKLFPVIGVFKEAGRAILLTS